MPERLDRAFRTAVAALDVPSRAAPGTPQPRAETRRPGAQTGEPAPPPPADRPDLLAIFTAQLRSRAADLVTRELRARGLGYYSISSAGHEANAAIGAALRPTDPALLHYRSGAFYAMRADQVGGIDPVRDILLGIVGAAADPISGGRHKVFGRVELAVIPQTSTIASHLPRAVGLAFALGRAAKLGARTTFPSDAVVVCSFGDASINHSTALGALNTARQLAYRGLPLPLLFVCEDNGLGISTATPAGWVEHAFGALPGLRYERVGTTDTWQALATARELAEDIRRQRRPALLHLTTVRFLGHAGTDMEGAYRGPAELAADLDRDPLVWHARALAGAGMLTPAEILERYDDELAHARAVADEVSALPQLSDARAIMAPLTRTQPDAVRHMADEIVATTTGPAVPTGKPMTVAEAIGQALRQILSSLPESLVFGEDVGRKGGVYGVTRGLQRDFGAARVFDTLLDEQTILGLGLGCGLAGMLPIPEIQYLAYLHNAEDQLRGEGATQAFFSAGRYTNPLVVRIAGYGYQKGFGGHFHNDNSVAVLRDIPGLIVASPARPDDAAAMLRTCAAVARVEGRVCVFLEPIALYHTRDLYADGDHEWLAVPHHEHIPVGRARSYGDGTALTIVTFGNGLWMSLRVARRLATRGIGITVVDLRWLAPLPMDDVERAARATGRVLVVDETRRTGGVSEGVVTALIDRGFDGRIARIAALDSFVPLGGSAGLVLVSEDDILVAAQDLLA